jgi:hypothetical protein
MKIRACRPPPHPSPASGGGSRPSPLRVLIPPRQKAEGSRMIGALACMDRARAQAPHHDRNEREHAERGERGD